MQIEPLQQKPYLPFKSVAAGLLFSVLLGPVGLLYGSVAGGIVMIAIGFIVLSAKLIVPILLYWSFCAVWCVSAVNRYNLRVIQKISTSQ